MKKIKLPVLTGTPYQVYTAEKIRDEVIDQYGQYACIRQCAKNQADASWWMERENIFCNEIKYIEREAEDKIQKQKDKLTDCKTRSDIFKLAHRITRAERENTDDVRDYRIIFWESLKRVYVSIRIIKYGIAEIERKKEEYIALILDGDKDGAWEIWTA